MVERYKPQGADYYHDSTRKLASTDDIAGHMEERLTAHSAAVVKAIFENPDARKDLQRDLKDIRTYHFLFNTTPRPPIKRPLKRNHPSTKIRVF